MGNSGEFATDILTDLLVSFGQQKLLSGFPSLEAYDVVSEESEAILEALKSVEQGFIDEDEFFAIHETSMKVIKKAKETMISEYMMAGESAISQLGSQLEFSQLACDRLLSFAGGENITSAAFLELAEDALQSLNELHWARMAFGEEGSNPANVFRNLLEYGEEIELMPNTWLIAIERCRAFYGAALNELESETCPSRPDSRRRLEALEQVLGALELLEDPQDNAALIVEEFAQALTALETELSSVRGDLRNFPTRYPHINLLYHGVQRFASGGIEEGFFEEIWASFLNKVGEDILNLRLAHAEEVSTLCGELYQVRFSLLEDLRDTGHGILDQLFDGAGGEDRLELLTELGSALAKNEEELEAFLRAKQRFICPKCGTDNSNLNKTCQGCQALLPRGISEITRSTSTFSELTDAPDEELPVVITQALKDLAQASMELQLGEISAQRYLELIESKRHDVKVAAAKLETIGMPHIEETLSQVPAEEANHLKWLQTFGHESLAQLREGFATCLSGLEILSESVEFLDVVEQQDGLKLYAEGCQIVWFSRQELQQTFS